MKQLILTVSLGAVTAGLMACGGAAFDKESAVTKTEEPGPTPIEPDPQPMPTPCVEGIKLGVWLDSNDDGSKQGETFLGSFIAFNGKESAATNYNYFSFSAHPLIGPQPGQFESNVFFYEGSDGLSFNFFHNVDATGSPDNIVNWDITTAGNQIQDNVILSDDPGEMILVVSGSKTNQYTVRDHYWYNTDGGVIGPFVGVNFSLAVKILDTGDMKNATFHSADGNTFSLMDPINQGQISSFIIGFEAMQVCQ